MSGPAVVHTVGHSTRSVEELIALLERAGVRALIDVRRFPGSRRHPHFGGAPLAAALGGRGIAYVHEPDLGGRRDPRPGSPNTAWRVAGFRGYADHMATPAFARALERVRAKAAEGGAAVMCAEAVPWRCHRQLIADALAFAGVEVLHLIGTGDCRRHEPNPAARVLPDGVIVYAGDPDHAQKPLFGPGGL